MHLRVALAAAAGLAAAAACSGARRAEVETAPEQLQAADSCARVPEYVAARGHRLADRGPVELAQALPPDVAPAAHDFVIAYVVDTAGRADPAAVRVSADAGARFQDAVRRVAPAWRYRPAVDRGCRVPYVRVDTIGVRIGPAR